MLKDLRPAEYNPRVQLKPGDHEFESLRLSIEEFGLVDPLIINRDGVIIGGHQRFAVLTDMGATYADCVVLNIDADREKALNVALNKIEGAWDVVKLDAILKELIDDGLEAMTGFTENELKHIAVHAVKEIKAANTEIDAEEFSDSKFTNECPRCGFMF